jgi:hypothetical protein
MKSVIFTEASSTTAELTEDQEVREYFKGGFLSVASLESDLAEFGETELHILSEDYGHLVGNEKSSNIIKSQASGVKSFKEALHSAAGESDAIVILLTKSTFESVVGESWQTVCAEAQRGSIWCFGASKSALSSINLDLLEQKDCDILTYERVGVARISSETREDLLDILELNAPPQG